MRFFALSALAAIASVSTAAASYAITTLHPCSNCPASNKVAPITVSRISFISHVENTENGLQVTSQLQQVWMCKPVTRTIKKKAFVTPSCWNYNFLSTSVPCLGGASTTVITKTNQYIELSHVSTVLTSYVDVPTICPPLPAPKYSYGYGYGNATVKYPTATRTQAPATTCTSTSTAYHTLVVDLSA